MTTAQSETTAWSRGCLDNNGVGNDARGGFPQQEGKGRSMQPLSNEEKTRSRSHLDWDELLIDAEKAGWLSLGSDLKEEE